MIIDFSEFEKGLTQCQLLQIQDDCKEASSKCPQSMDIQYAPKKLNEEVLRYWCKNETLFKFGYKVYLKKSTMEILKKYRAYLELKINLT